MPRYPKDLEFELQRRQLALNIRNARKAQKLRQWQLAEIMGSSQTYISEIERLDGTPTLITLFRLSKALGVPPEQLLAGCE